jgi:uncharacterized lipoprotein YajG
MKHIFFFTLMLVSLAGWAQTPKKIYIENVGNKIQIGKLAGNRNLAFGVKNILDESLSDKYDLVPSADNADYTLQVDIVFLDVESSNMSIGILHQDEQAVVISMAGRLLKGDKVIKQKTATEKSSEISMSTLVISEAGGFNQTSLSNALKKASVSLTTKLFDKI